MLTRPSGALPNLTRNAVIDSGTANLPAAVSGSAQVLTVGNSGTGMLTVSGGLLDDGIAYLGNLAGSSGTVRVSSGTWVTNPNGPLVVGDSGTGALYITGGSVIGGPGYIGNNAGSSGTVTVTSGTWKDYSYLTVGNYGVGALNISGGIVTGTSASSLPGIYIGSGSGSIGILNMNGGMLFGAACDIGFNAGSSGTATITSGTWNAGSGLAVGYSGTGVFNLTGGTVTAQSGCIGGSQNGIGTVNVSSGTWACTSGAISNVGLTVGNIGTGTGTLNITGSGVVNVVNGTGVVALGSSPIGPGCDGVLNIGTGGTPGTLNAAEVMSYIGVGVATLNFNNSVTGTFTPGITDSSFIPPSPSLIVNKLGAGTMVLASSGSDYSYTGTTTISAGTLQFGNGGATHINLTGNMVNNGILTIDSSVSGTLGPVISGSGALNQIGTGTTTLTGTNNYTGGTIIDFGTLTLASAKGSTSPAALTESGTNLIVGNNNGDIGTLLLAHGGMVYDLNGYVGMNAGSYGVADIFSGTWKNDRTIYVGCSGTGTLNITGGVVNVHSGTGTIYLGSGTGSTGTTVLAGNESYTGTTTVGAGMLTVNGSITSSQAVVNGGVLNGSGTAGNVTVNSGGTLGGTLTCGIVVANAGGSVTAGDAPGANTMTSLSLGGSASYLAQIAVPASGSYAGPHPASGIEYGQTTLTGTGDGQSVLALDAANSILRLNVTGALPSGGVASPGNPYDPNGSNDTLDNYFILHLSDAADVISGEFAQATADGVNFVNIDYSAGNLVGSSAVGTFTLSGTEWAISYTGDETTNSTTGGDDVAFTALMAVPEPGSWALLGMGALVVVFVLRWKRILRQS